MIDHSVKMKAKPDYNALYRYIEMHTVIIHMFTS